MKRAIITIILASSLLISFCGSRVNSQEQSAMQTEDLLSDAKCVPFEIYKNLIYIDVTIADTVKSKFIFDTGCLYFVLDSTLYVNNFGKVDTLMRAVTDGAGENKEYGKVAKGLWNYQFSGIKYSERNAFVMNLKKFIRYEEVGGIFGTMFMRKSNRNIIVDFQNSKIYLLKQDSNKKIGNSAQGHYHNFHHVPFVKLDLYINDSVKISGDFLLDLGAASGITLTSNTVKDYNLESNITYSEEKKGVGAGGAYSYRVFQADSASIAGYTVKDFKAEYSLSKSGALSDSRYIGLVGYSFLKNFTLQIDFKSGGVWLKPNETKE